MKVKLVQEDAERLDTLIRIGEEILAAVKALQPPLPIDLLPILTELGAIEATLTDIDNNTKPEPPSSEAVGIEIVPGKPTTQA